ncbi:hypothetical protein QW180_03585 [Vibrio sinaloensis]|nr:hypothetical protein [Vibrio sinaloensis]
MTIGGSYAFNDYVKIRTGITNLTDERLDDTDLDYQATEVGRAYYFKLDFEY